VHKVRKVLIYYHCPTADYGPCMYLSCLETINTNVTSVPMDHESILRRRCESTGAANALAISEEEIREGHHDDGQKGQ
jgi:hypothetical protein